MESLFNIAGENIVLMFHEMNHVVRGRSSPVLRGEAQPLPLLASLCLVATGQSRIVQPTWGQQPTATEARIWLAGDGGSGRTLRSDIIPVQPNFQFVQLSGRLILAMMAGLEGGETAPLKPHAQAHLLSPTDKCKVCITCSYLSIMTFHILI